MIAALIAVEEPLSRLCGFDIFASLRHIPRWRPTHPSREVELAGFRTH